jgi:hypothetical protein
MLETTGNIWSAHENPNSWIGVTTNRDINMYGHLIMGKGIAKQCVEKFPKIPIDAGKIICRMKDGEDYHIIEFTQHRVILLQTKRHWQDASPLSLVTETVKQLGELARKNPSHLYNIVQPGCGLGGLDWKGQVYPLCKELPDNVIVWSM